MYYPILSTIDTKRSEVLSPILAPHAIERSEMSYPIFSTLNVESGETQHPFSEAAWLSRRASRVDSKQMVKLEGHPA
jgi:hypothetical protein